MYMGTCTSKTEDIESLKEQIRILMENSKALKPPVTQEEFLEWKQAQQTKFDELEAAVEKKTSLKYNTLMAQKDAQITELTKQVESLKNTNSTLEAKVLHIASTQNTQEHKQLKELSKAKVDEFVEKLLTDEDVNIKYLPDFVERQLYKNVLNLVLNLLDNTFNTTSIKFLGHLLTFDIVPDKTPGIARDLEKDEIVKDEEEKKEKDETVFLDQKEKEEIV